MIWNNFELFYGNVFWFLYKLCLFKVRKLYKKNLVASTIIILKKSERNIREKRKMSNREKSDCATWKSEDSRKINGEMKYLAGKLKCQIAVREREREKDKIKDTEFRLLIYSITRQERAKRYSNAQVRGASMCCFCALLHLHLRKFVKNSTPVSPVLREKMKTIL